MNRSEGEKQHLVAIFLLGSKGYRVFEWVFSIVNELYN